MPTLHIIGNGFDLAHGIESSYEDFKRYAWSHSGTDGYYLNLLETCYPEINPSTGDLELWSDLEHALGKPDIEAAFSATTEDVEYEEGHEIRYQPQMEDAPTFFLSSMFDVFHKVFEEWVNNIDIDVEPLPDIPHFDKTGKFLSFNYTETLESLYGVHREQINYLHGRRENLDELIVGHCNDIDGQESLPEDPLIYMYEGYDNVAREINSQQKKVSDIIAVNMHFWQGLSEIDKVVVYGHSLSDIDMPYLKEVARYVRPDAEWFFSIYYNNPVERDEEINVTRNAIEEIGLDTERCHTFKIRQEI